jgi:hypothetical protein
VLGGSVRFLRSYWKNRVQVKKEVNRRFKFSDNANHRADPERGYDRQEESKNGQQPPKDAGMLQKGLNFIKG